MDRLLRMQEHMSLLCRALVRSDAVKGIQAVTICGCYKEPSQILTQATRGRDWRAQQERDLQQLERRQQASQAEPWGQEGWGSNAPPPPPPRPYVTLDTGGQVWQVRQNSFPY